MACPPLRDCFGESFSSLRLKKIASPFMKSRSSWRPQTALCAGDERIGGVLQAA